MLPLRIGLSTIVSEFAFHSVYHNSDFVLNKYIDFFNLCTYLSIVQKRFYFKLFSLVKQFLFKKSYLVLV